MLFRPRGPTALLACAVAVLWLFAAPPGQKAMALPVLQLYIEDAVYDPVSETWVLDTTRNNPNWEKYVVPGTTITHFRLWTLGDVSQSDDGAIHNVRLAAVYDGVDGGYVNLTITPSTTMGYAGFTDPSAPVAPQYLQTVTDGSTPKLSGGSDLPSHGEYGPGKVWQEWALGDFTLKDSPLGDFINSVPEPLQGKMGQINVYDVYEEHSYLNGVFPIHFDLYDSIQS